MAVRPRGFDSLTSPADPENNEVPCDKPRTLSSDVKMTGDLSSPQPCAYDLITSASSIKNRSSQLRILTQICVVKVCRNLYIIRISYFE
jgi:hypothetical protein